MSAPMTPERLAEIRARAEEASPGPWTVVPADGCVDHINAGDGYDPIVRTDGGVYPPEMADAEFIAHARDDVPTLLAEVDRLRKDRAELLADNDRLRSWGFRLRKEASALWRYRHTHPSWGLPGISQAELDADPSLCVCGEHDPYAEENL